MKKLSTKSLDKIYDVLDYLLGRWEDECEYEDWADYVIAMKEDLKKIDKNITYGAFNEKMLLFYYGKHTYHIKVLKGRFDTTITSTK